MRTIYKHDQFGGLYKVPSYKLDKETYTPNERLHRIEPGPHLAKEFRAALADGANINSRPESQTLLITAAANSLVDIAVWIARHARETGANLDTCDRYRWRKLAWTGGKGGEAYRYPFGWSRGEFLKNTALIIAVKKGWDHFDCDRSRRPKKSLSAIIIALLEGGANPDIRDACGNTALHIAILRRDEAAVAKLLKHGARLDIKNNGGLLPQQLLDVDYKNIHPFLIQQCGNDSAYGDKLLTFRNEKSWIAARPHIEKLIRDAHPVKNDAPKAGRAYVPV